MLFGLVIAIALWGDDLVAMAPSLGWLPLGFLVLTVLLVAAALVGELVDDA